jgi:hypothetical protein
MCVELPVMKTNLLSPAARGPVSRKMVLMRAREVAVSHGRSSHDTVETDFAQAKRELTGMPTGPALAPTKAAPQ